MRRLLLLAFISFAACQRPLSIDNRPCPCAVGWQCCSDGQTCVRQGAVCSGAVGDLGPPPDDLVEGLHWEPVRSGTAKNLYGVWGSGAGDIYVVGAGGTILHSQNGREWNAQNSEVSGTDGSLFCVWGSSASDIYIGGSNGVLLHSTGDGWWTRQGVATTGAIMGIYGGTSDDVVAVALPNQLFVRSSSGWDEDIGFNRVATLNNHSVGPVAVWGEKAIAGFGALYNVAGFYDGSILHGSKQSGWDSNKNRVPGSLSSVWGSGIPFGLVIAVGGQGNFGDIIWRQDPNATIEVTTPGLSRGLNAVWGHSQDNQHLDVFAAGADGVILHSVDQAKSWTIESGGPKGATADTLRGLWGSGSADVYAVGDNGTMVHHW